MSIVLESGHFRRTSDRTTDESLDVTNRNEQLISNGRSDSSLLRGEGEPHPFWDTSYRVFKFLASGGGSALDRKA